MQLVMSVAGVEPVVVGRGEPEVREVQFDVIDCSRDSGSVTYYESQIGGRLGGEWVVI